MFVAGTTGFDYAAMTIAEGPAEQTRQPSATSNASSPRLAPVSPILSESDTTYPNRDDWPRIVPVLAEIFGAIRPAATAVFCGLVDERMKIEIEVTARRKANE